MAATWTAEIVKVDKNKAGTGFDVTYVIKKDADIKESQILRNNASVPATYPHLKRRIEILRTIDETDTSVFLGTVDFSKIPGPTDKQTFENARLELLRAKQDLDAGLITKEAYDKKLAAVTVLTPVSVAADAVEGIEAVKP